MSSTKMLRPVASLIINAQFDGASQSASGILHLYGQYYQFTAKLDFVLPTAMDLIPAVLLPTELMDELIQSERSHQTRAFGYNSSEGSCRYFILRELERISRREDKYPLPPEDAWQVLHAALTVEWGSLDDQLIYQWRKTFSEQWFALKNYFADVT